MKIGAYYSVFNGEELLEHSIKSIFNNVEFIVVFYQTTSNYGNTNKELLTTISYLKNKYPTIKFIEFTPHITEELLVSGIFNNLHKRNLGLEECRKNNCTHFLGLDADEFYKEDELKNAINIIKEGDYDSSFCEVEVYYNQPTCRLTPKMERYFFPFLYKIRPNTSHELDDNWDKNLFVDNCRRMKKGKEYVFTRKELEMHHFSYVRKNIRSKYKNISYTTLLNPKWIDKMERDYNNFDLNSSPEVSILMADGIKKSQYEIVNNHFNIKI